MDVFIQKLCMNPDEKIITKLEVLNKNLILKLQQTCKTPFFHSLLNFGVKSASLLINSLHFFDIG
jgi:hypothetical protein